MIYAAIQHDSYRRIKLIRHSIDKNELKPLKHGETVMTYNSIEEARLKIDSTNEMIKNQLMGIMKSIPEAKRHEERIQLPDGFDKSKVSEKSKDLIMEFLKNPTDRLTGMVMTAHNKEEWTNLSFCCGSQKQTLINLLTQEYGV